MDLFRDPQELQEQTQHFVTAATTWAADMHDAVSGSLIDLNDGVESKVVVYPSVCP